MTSPSDPQRDALDPEAVLGVQPDASEEEIRAAYLAKVREYPPDRSPEEFERVRDAYDLLRDPRRRARNMILENTLDEPLAAWLDRSGHVRRFVGPDAWLEALAATPPQKEKHE